MGLFNGSYTLFFLSQNSLYIFSSKNHQAPLIFPEQAVSHQEIKDKKLFEQVLKDYFSHLSKQQAILFLSDEVVFHKSVTLSPNQTIEGALKAFLDTVPFQETSVASKVIQGKSDVLVFATNADFYKTIIAVASGVGITIKRVVPLLAFQQELQGKPASFSVLSHVIGEKERMEQADFLEIKEEKPKEPLPIKQLIVLVISLCFFVGAIILLLINLGIITYKAEKKMLTPKPTHAIFPTAVPSPTLSASDEAALKKEIKIQITNASGAPGAATNVKNELNKVGFTDILVGNSTASVSGTTVGFTASVSASVKQEIVRVLSSLFTPVTTQEITAPSDFSVSITIGQ